MLYKQGECNVQCGCDSRIVSQRTKYGPAITALTEDLILDILDLMFEFCPGPFLGNI